MFEPAESHVTFGGWDMDKYAKAGSELVWHPNVSDSYWGLNLE